MNLINLYTEDQRKNPQKLNMIIECLHIDLVLKRNIFPNYLLNFSNNDTHHLTYIDNSYKNSDKTLVYELFIILLNCLTKFEGTEEDFKIYVLNNNEYDDMDHTTSVYSYVNINGIIFNYISETNAPIIINFLLENINCLDIKFKVKKDEFYANKILRYFSSSTYDSNTQNLFLKNCME